MGGPPGHRLRASIARGRDGGFTMSVSQKPRERLDRQRVKYRVVTQESLTADREITFKAGTHTEAIRMSFEDYQRLAEPKVGRLADPPARVR
jgi:hypothetical protein